MSVSMTGVKSGQGQIVGLLGALTEQISEEVLWLDPEGRVLFCSGKLEKCFPGLSVGNCAAAGELPGSLQEAFQRLENTPGQLPVGHLRFTLQKPGQESHCNFMATISPVTDDAGGHAGYVVLAGDIADHVGLRALKQEAESCGDLSETAREEAVDHEKMVALGTLAAGVAHEIGNPLASLSAVVQLLKRRISSEESLAHLDTLDELINRIVRIVRQMLEFSRPSPEEHVVTNIDELVERTVKMVRYSQRARETEIISRRNGDLPRLRMMPQLFQQVLVNLLLNALDAVEEKEGRGKIWVERAVRDGDVRVAVRDSGVGMTREQVQRAFEPFYTTKSSPKGTGLGLAVSYRLVQRQGGDISIQSTPNQGTTATIKFPIQKSCP